MLAFAIDSSAMSSSRAIFILIVGHLFSSSASYLKAKKVTLQETAPTKSRATSTVDHTITSRDKSLTPLATSDLFVTTTLFTDTDCFSPYSEVVEVLNTCFRNDDASFVQVTATLSSVSRVTYSDSLCTDKLNETNSTNSADVCLQKSQTVTSADSLQIEGFASANQRWIKV